MTTIKGYVRADQQEEFEAWEKEQVKLREQESNEALKKLRANGYYPSVDERELAFRNSNAFNDY